MGYQRGSSLSSWVSSYFKLCSDLLLNHLIHLLFFFAFRRSFSVAVGYGDSAICHIYLCISNSRIRYCFFLTLPFLSCNLFVLVWFFSFPEMPWFSSEGQLLSHSLLFALILTQCIGMQQVCFTQLDWRISGCFLSLITHHSSAVFHVNNSCQLMVR